jgi:hypothetical protein|nr:MAG TPA: hypothetical protein [Caudoviricetes sp.]
MNFKDFLETICKGFEQAFETFREIFTFKKSEKLKKVTKNILYGISDVLDNVSNAFYYVSDVVIVIFALVLIILMLLRVFDIYL